MLHIICDSVTVVIVSCFCLKAYMKARMLLCHSSPICASLLLVQILKNTDSKNKNKNKKKTHQTCNLLFHSPVNTLLLRYTSSICYRVFFPIVSLLDTQFFTAFSLLQLWCKHLPSVPGRSSRKGPC